MSPAPTPPPPDDDNNREVDQEAGHDVTIATTGDGSGEVSAEEQASPSAVIAPPVIAIVGRPNVGKSTLLNAMARTRVAIVEPTPGVTRDRIGVLCTYAERTVEVVDTGGVGIVDMQGLEEDVEGQIASAVENADVILFVVDARDGLMQLDSRVGELLRRTKTPVLLLANKVEGERPTWNLHEFLPLSYGEPLPISAKEKIGLDALESLVERYLPKGKTTPVRMAPPDLRLAIVGRMNAGKSSLVNALIHQDRMIVSEVPGTTRDSVDIRFELDGRSFVAIDTAGIRKEKTVHGSVDFYAQRRAEKAMRRANVTALVLDATRDVGRLDRKIADYAVRFYQPVVIVANKWDLCDDMTPKAFTAYLDKALPGNRYAPIVYASALTGWNVHRVMDVAWGLFQQATTRVGTSEVNSVLESAYALRKPRPKKGKIGRIYYGSQVEIEPPTFVVFVNETWLFPKNYIRYLENRIREAFPMDEVPVKIVLKARDRSPSKNMYG